jgi:hypothetical protein
MGVELLSLQLTAILAVAILVLPRRFALLPLFVAVTCLPVGSGINLGGISLHPYRLILILACGRLVFRQEISAFRTTRFDRVFACWLAATLILGTFTQPSVFSERLISRLGIFCDALAAYAFIRCIIRDEEDVLHALRSLVLIAVPLAILAAVEHVTGRNLFSYLGGVPEYTAIREGKVRSQGAFRHAILAGTFGATIFPLASALWGHGRSGRRNAVIGALAGTAIVYTATSSGALLTLLASIGGLYLWRYRFKMRVIRNITLLAIVALAAVMNAPVWYIFSRLSDLVGGTGWYRSFLIDQAVQHFDEWWFNGTNYTVHWAPGGETPVGNPNHTDIVNHFVAEALDGGILKLTFFCLLIYRGFRVVGVAVHHPDLSSAYTFLYWALGVTLFAHCISFLSVAYFDQSVVHWYFLLAALASLESAQASRITASQGAPVAA